MADEIGELDLTAQAGAAQTATNYITTVSNDGIWVTPSDAKPSNGQPVSTTRGWHIANALEYFRGTIRYIKAWLNGSVPTVRLGQDNAGHADVTPDGLEVFTDDSTSVAQFGESGARIGSEDGTHARLSSDALELYKYAEEIFLDSASARFSADGAILGDVTGTNLRISPDAVSYSIGETETFAINLEQVNGTHPTDDRPIRVQVFDDLIGTGTLSSDGYLIGDDVNVHVDASDHTWCWIEASSLKAKPHVYIDAAGYTSDDEREWVDVEELVLGEYGTYEYTEPERYGPTADGYRFYFRVQLDSALFSGVRWAVGTLHYDKQVSVRVGKQYVEGSDSNENHLELDYHSLQLIDKEGNTYFHVSDLRDTSGHAGMRQKFVGDGIRRTFSFDFHVISVESVTIGGLEQQDSDYTWGNSILGGPYIEFVSAPSDGALIIVSYTTDDLAGKAYTLGIRMTDSDIGPYSFAHGTGIEAEGYASNAFGVLTRATGNYAHAEGYNTQATGEASHAEGGYDPGILHVEVGPVVASGLAAHAEGCSTTASGNYSHAEGEETVASGDYAHAQNYGTVASSGCQTAIGKCNDNQSGNVFEIGNGASRSNPSNAFAVEWNGNVWMGPRLTLDADSNNTGALRFQSDNRLGEFIKLYGASDANGDATVINNGGLIIIGGGESASGLYDALVTNGSMNPGTEHMIIGADTNIYLYPNCQTIANRKELIITNKGCIQNNAACSFGSHSWLSILNGETAMYVPKDRTSSTTANYAVGALSIETPGGGGWSISNYNSENLLFTYIDGTSRSANQNNAYSVNLPAVSASKTICFTDHTHNTADITSGTLADARLPTKGSAGTAGTSSTTSGSTLAVPYITTDAYGRVTAKGTHTHTVTGFFDTTTSRTANTVLAAPSGSAGAASFRKLVVADLPTGTTASTVSLGNHTHAVTNKSYTGSNTAQIAANGTASITVSGTSGGTSLVGFTYLYTNHNTVIGIAGNNETTVYVHNLTSTARAASYCTVTELRKYMF